MSEVQFSASFRLQSLDLLVGLVHLHVAGLDMKDCSSLKKDAFSPFSRHLLQDNRNGYLWFPTFKRARTSDLAWSLHVWVGKMD